jgi:hypothetical protein
MPTFIPVVDPSPICPSCWCPKTPCPERCGQLICACNFATHECYEGEDDDCEDYAERPE